MSKENAPEKTKPKDPFEDCLRVALTFFGVHADLMGLLSRAPRDKGKHTLDDLAFVVDKLGLEAEKFKYSAGQLKKLESRLYGFGCSQRMWPRA